MIRRVFAGRLAFLGVALLFVGAAIAVILSFLGGNSYQEVADIVFRQDASGHDIGGVYLGWEPGSDPGNPEDHSVVYHKGLFLYPEEISLGEFGESGYLGAYAADEIEAAQRAAIVETALDIVDLKVPYSLMRSAVYRGDAADVNNVALLRADGLVEYCYEVNGVPIYRSDLDGEELCDFNEINYAFHKDSLADSKKSRSPRLQREKGELAPTRATDPSRVRNLKSEPTGSDGESCRIKIGWSEAIDLNSGVAGYFVKWDAHEGSIPVAEDIWAPAGSKGITGLVIERDKEYWLHVRSVDRAGNWDAEGLGYDSIKHFGPFYIDETGLNGPDLWDIGLEDDMTIGEDGVGEEKGWILPMVCPGIDTAPTAVIEVDSVDVTGETIYALIGDTITFDGSFSYDNDEDSAYITGYSWSGGGTPSTGSSSTFATVWSGTGTKTVTLIVTDNEGDTDDGSVNVYVMSESSAWGWWWFYYPDYEPPIAIITKVGRIIRDYILTLDVRNGVIYLPLNNY